MTAPPAPPAVTLGAVSLSTTDLLRLRHQRGRPVPLPRDGEGA
jgi:hypothetical protein